jgi:hypothetical protein
MGEEEDRDAKHRAAMRNHPHHQPIEPPDDLPGFPDAREAKPKTPRQDGNGLRKRWKDGKRRIYEWDYRHGRVEVYGKRGKPHLGEFDFETGKLLSKGKNRRVEP